MILTIELVPKSCWFSNLRDHLTEAQWKEVKLSTFKAAGNRCEICQGVGDKWPVECHEVWAYDDINKVQRLVRTVALCPPCHQVKHIGMAMVTGRYNHAKSHFSAINKVPMRQTERYIEKAFNLFNDRSKFQWKLDVSWINQNFGFTIKEKR